MSKTSINAQAFAVTGNNDIQPYLSLLSLLTTTIMSRPFNNEHYACYE